MDWTGGLLQVLGGAGQGGAAAVQKNNNDKLEALKASATAAREEFLLNLQRGWAKEDTKNAQDFTTKTNETTNGYNVSAAKTKAEVDLLENNAKRLSEEGLNKAKIESTNRNSDNSISAQERMNAASTGATLEAARIRSQKSGSADSGAGLLNAKTNVYKAIQEITSKTDIKNDDVALVQVNKLLESIGEAPLSVEDDGVTTTGGFLGLGGKKVRNKKIIQANSAIDFDSIAQKALGKEAEPADPDQPKVPQSEKAQPEKEKQQGLLVTPETETAEPVSKPEVNPELPDNVRQWDVKELKGEDGVYKYYAFVPGKREPVEISDEEYKYWFKEKNPPREEVEKPYYGGLNSPYKNKK